MPMWIIAEKRELTFKDNSIYRAKLVSSEWIINGTVEEHKVFEENGKKYSYSLNGNHIKFQATKPN